MVGRRETARSEAGIRTSAGSSYSCLGWRPRPPDTELLRSEVRRCCTKARVARAPGSRFATAGDAERYLTFGTWQVCIT